MVASLDPGNILELVRMIETQSPQVVAVILTWNDVEMTSRCIESVQANDYPCKQIVVVDNGSSPPACPVLKPRYPTIDTVQLDRNYGFTVGCNRGMERALEKGVDYVFLLNNDTIVGWDTISHLVSAMEECLEVGMGSAVLLYPGNERCVQFLHAAVHRDSAYQWRSVDRALLEGGPGSTVETDFAPACAVLFRAEALRQVGLFDETLFTNWEDYDLCCRFQDAGWKIITVGAAEVVHAHGQTTGRTSPFITYLFTRNRLICLFRYGRLTGILKNAFFIARSFYWQVRGYGLTNWPCHAAFLRGILHFLLGIRGDRGPQNTKDRKKAS